MCLWVVLPKGPVGPGLLGEWGSSGPWADGLEEPALQEGAQAGTGYGWGAGRGLGLHPADVPGLSDQLG